MTEPRKSLFERMSNSSFLMASLATVAFYGVVHSPAFEGSMIKRYTTHHAVEYVIVAFFILGIVEILYRCMTFPTEMRALDYDWLPPHDGREPVARAEEFLEQVRQQPPQLVNTRMGKRISEALHFVVANGGTSEYREHLQLLADKDEDLTRFNYAVVRFVIWVSPVLGFLGTVLHFGTALSGISVKGMAEQLEPVVNEMGSAFNTTTIALATATTMMFLVFLCERAERRRLNFIDRFIDRELANRFESRDASTVPLLNILRTTNQDALAAINHTLNRQVDAWNGALDMLFTRFDGRAQQEWKGWQEMVGTIQQRLETSDASRERRFEQLLAGVEGRQNQHFVHINKMIERIVELRQDFAGFVAALRQLAEGEETLIDLQTRLTDNLQTLQQSQHFDEAMHGLTAAIHLMTARHRPAMPESAAA